MFQPVQRYLDDWEGAVKPEMFTVLEVTSCNKKLSMD